MQGEKSAARVLIADKSDWDAFAILASALRSTGVIAERVTFQRGRPLQRLASHVLYQRLQQLDPAQLERWVAQLDPSQFLDIQASDEIALQLAKLGKLRRTNLPDECLLYDKFAMARVVAHTGVRVPVTRASIQEVADVRLDPGSRVVVKTRLGYSGTGVRIACEARAIEEAFRELTTSHGAEGVCVQEFVDGVPVRLGGIADHGHVVQFVAHRPLVDFEDPLGPTKFTRTIRDGRAADLAAAIIDAIGFTGPFGIDCIQRRDGSYVFIELNARVWGPWAAFAWAGVDFLHGYRWIHGLGPRPTQTLATADVELAIYPSAYVRDPTSMVGGGRRQVARQYRRRFGWRYSIMTELTTTSRRRRTRAPIAAAPSSQPLHQRRHGVGPPCASENRTNPPDAIPPMRT